MTNERQRKHLEIQRELLNQEFSLAELEFERHRRLADKKVISIAEYQQQHAIFLNKQHPIKQIESSLMNNESNMISKKKEVSELTYQINEEKYKFKLALQSMISEIEQCKLKYILTAPQSGILVYAGIIQNNQFIENGMTVFYINPGNTEYFGEINIPQYNLGKVNKGQHVLIKLHSYPFQQYGTIEGEISQLNYVPIQDSIFFSKVRLNTKKLHHQIQLRTGLNGTAEIITEDISLLSRLYRNFFKIMN